MKTKTEQHSLPESLELQTPEGRSVTLRSPKLTLVFKGEKDVLHLCGLKFQVDNKTYEEIDTGHCFNLQPEVRTAFKGEPFSVDHVIAFSTRLRPDLLSEVAERLKSEQTGDNEQQQENNRSQQLAQALLSRLDDWPEDLLQTESWFGLQVSQGEGSQAKGYRTFWDSLQLSARTPHDLEKGRLLVPITDFLKSRPDLDISTLNSDLLEGFGELFESEITDFLTLLDDSIDENTTSSPAVSTSESPPTEFANLYEVTLRFFQSQNWPVQELRPKELLSMAYQSEIGQWNCYMQVQTSSQQLIFYSLCPLTVPESHRAHLAQVLTRLNFGLIIGNFELNLETGEIRYKTSIDLEGTQPVPTLVKQLVISNVTAMETYLPKIMEAIYQAL